MTAPLPTSRVLGSVHIDGIEFLVSVPDAEHPTPTTPPGDPS